MRKTNSYRKTRRRGGFTLLEVAIALFIIASVAVSISGTLVVGLQAAEAGTDRLTAIQILTEQIELLRSAAMGNFNAIVPPPGIIFMRQQPVTIANGYPANNRLLGRAAVHIDIQRMNVPIANNPDLVEVRGTISWRGQSNRLYGEDANLNGALDPGEDLNGDGVLTSPVQITTRFTRR